MSRAASVKKSISPEVFVRCWESSGSTSEAAEALSAAVGREVSANYARMRASNLRGYGVNLKTMGPGRPLELTKAEVRRLNALIKSIG